MKLLTAVDILGSYPTAQDASTRKFPVSFLVNYAAAILDGKTGELLEYRHLIKMLEYEKDWGFSFGNEIGRLAQGMP